MVILFIFLRVSYNKEMTFMQKMSASTTLATP